MSPYGRVREMRGHFPNNPRPHHVLALGFTAVIALSGGRLNSLRSNKPDHNPDKTVLLVSTKEGKFGDCFQVPFVLSLSKYELPGVKVCILFYDRHPSSSSGRTVFQWLLLIVPKYPLIRSRASQI